MFSPCHVTSDVSASCDRFRLLVCFPFPSHVTLTVLVCVMVARLDSSLSCLCFLAYASYSSPVMSIRLLPGYSYAHLCPGRLVSCSSPSPCYALYYPNDSSLDSLSDSFVFLSCPFTVLTPVCTCIVPTCIYTGLEMGCFPSSIYFATTLKL